MPDDAWDVIGWYSEAGAFYLTRQDKWLPGAFISMRGWNEWINSEGQSGEVPPPHVLDFRNRYFNGVLTSATQEEMADRFEDLMMLSVYNMWSTLTLHLPSAGHANADLRNVRWEGISIEASNHYARLQTYWWDR